MKSPTLSVAPLLRVRHLSALLLLGAVLSVAGGARATTEKLSAEQIVERNVQARGGLSAWRNVQAISLSGKMDAGRIRPNPSFAAVDPRNPKQRKQFEEEQLKMQQDRNKGTRVQLPFRMELARTRRARVEIEFHGDTAVQVFDGKNGWKLRPFLGRKEWEPFTAEEAKRSADQQDIDGLLIDAAAKGNKVSLEGMEPIAGRDAYRLAVKLPNGDLRHVWVDAASFLDVQFDGPARRMDGKERAVTTVASDFRRVGGVKIPFALETRVDTVADTERIVVEKAQINPTIDASRFAAPVTAGH